MAERKREIQVKFWVTPEEKKMIRKKMILSKTANMGAYLRKMAIDGIIVNTDTTYLEKQFYEMHKIGVNVNQLATPGLNSLFSSPGLLLAFFLQFIRNPSFFSYSNAIKNAHSRDHLQICE